MCSTFSLQPYKEFGEELSLVKIEFGEEFKAVGSDRDDGPRLCSTGWW